MILLPGMKTMGSADPSFSASDIITNGNKTKYIHLADDLDRDGDMDIISHRKMMMLLHGTKTIMEMHQAWTARDLPSRWCSRSFLADLDSDGDIDIVSSSKNDDRIAWHENDGALILLFYEYN